SPSTPRPPPGSATARTCPTASALAARSRHRRPLRDPGGSPCDLADEAELPRLDDRLQLGVHRQLVAKAADMRADGRVADPQLLRDRAAGYAFRHEPQDFLLSRRQPLELGLDRPALGEQRRD